MKKVDKRILPILIILIIYCFFKAIIGIYPIFLKEEQVPSKVSKEEQASINALSRMKWQLQSISKQGESASNMLEGNIQASSYYMNISKNGYVYVRGDGNTISDGKIRIEKPNELVISSFMMTLVDYGNNLNKSDDKIQAYLRGKSSYKLTNDTLIISSLNSDKHKLVFRGIPTPETRYGSKGVRRAIIVKRTVEGIKWFEVKNSDYLIGGFINSLHWKGSLPNIKDFDPKMNWIYIVHFDEYTDPETNNKIWIKDETIEISGLLSAFNKINKETGAIEGFE